jgi:subtilisin family serine protease
VALAIYAAVEGWRERRLDDPATSPRLVLNLSLGWEPAYHELAPSQALLTALRFASCNGVLVFASAGNDPGGRASHSGPLEPAAFEMMPAPEAAECRALGFAPLDEHEYPVFGANKKPLVWAVGGVDANDRPLSNARGHSMPRLVSPALDGLAMGQDGELTRALSGSSIAAAVASGTAALIWSYRPELRPDQIVEIIYDSGWDTNQLADFGLDGPVAIHRVSVCAALARACDSDSPHPCPALDCAARAPANHEHRSALVEALRRLHDDPNTSVRVHR